MAYDIPTSESIEKSYRAKERCIDLSNTPLGIPNVLDFQAKVQFNKHTHFQRQVQRLAGQRYPTAVTQDVNTPSMSPNNSLHPTAAVNGHVASSNIRASKSDGTSKGAKTAVRGARSKKVKVEQSQGKHLFFSNLTIFYSEKIKAITAVNEDWVFVSNIISISLHKLEP